MYNDLVKRKDDVIDILTNQLNSCKISISDAITNIMDLPSQDTCKTVNIEKVTTFDNRQR